MATSRVMEYGLMEKLRTVLVIERIIDERKAAERMMRDPEVLEALPPGVKIRPVDVRKAKEAIERGTKETLDAALAKSSQAKELAAQAHTKMAQYVDDMDRAHKLLDSMLNDIPVLAKRAMSDERDDKGKPVHKYPSGEIRALLEVIKTGMQMVQQIKSDSDIRTFLKAGTVNVNQGLSIEDVLDMLERMAPHLGVTEAQMFSAYAKAKSEPKGVVIDADYKLKENGV